MQECSVYQGSAEPIERSAEIAETVSGRLERCYLGDVRADPNRIPANWPAWPQPTIWRRAKPTFAGRSASRRMYHAYQASP